MQILNQTVADAKALGGGRVSLVPDKVSGEDETLTMLGIIRPSKVPPFSQWVKCHDADLE